MTMVYKNFGVQGTSAIGTYATLYETTSSTSAVVSTIAICNTSATSATYRIGIDDSPGTPVANEWLIYDATVAANDTIFLTVGIAISASRFIRISSSANTVTFSAFVSEIS
jgi:hypothetical protein